MVWWMKTTVDISDPILRRAKQLAARRGVTLRVMIEDALRVAIEQDGPRGAVATPVVTHAFRGRGLQPGFTWGDWSGLRAAAYEGRGG